MTERIYPKPEKERVLPDLRWEVQYLGLVYDGGGTATWVSRYRTRIGARIAAWWHYYVLSWGGGSVTLTDRRVTR